MVTWPQCRIPKFNPWVGKITWSRECLLTWYSCLEHSMDRGAWWAVAHEIVKSWIWQKLTSGGKYGQIYYMFITDWSWIENQILKKIKRYFQRGKKRGKEKNIRAKRKQTKKIPKKEINTWVNLNEQTHENLTNTYYRLFLIYHVIT